MKFELGAGVQCDLQTLIDTRALVQANSGGGKSHTLRRLLEQTHGRVQHLVIDAEGEFASLRERYDYVLAAKQGGDTAADPRSAKLLAERVLELGVSTIVDIYELKHHDRIRFVRYFLEALVDAPKRLWHPALVVLDEAHVFCPQQGEAESAGAVIDLSTRGRKRGFCAVLATQRLSKLHKDAAAELNNKLIGRTGLDVDRKRAAEELGFTDREQPEAEERQRTEIELKRDLAQARATITRLERAAPARVETKVQTKIERVEVPILSNGDGSALRDAVRGLQEVFLGCTQLVERLVEAGGQVAKIGQGIEVAIARAAGPDSPARRPVQTSAPPRHLGPNVGVASQRTTLHQSAPRARAAPTVDGEFQPSSSQQRIVDALAWLASIGLSPANKNQLAFLAGQRSTSGGYFNNLGALRSAGLIEYPQPGTVELTETGRGRAAPPDQPPTAEGLHRQIQGKVSRSQWAILQALIDVYPETLTKDELAERSGQRARSGGYFNNLGTLRTLGLIDYPTRGRVAGLPVLFLGSGW